MMKTSGRKAWRLLAILASAFCLLFISHYVVPSGIFHTGLHEVGFALLVSLVVWGLFEAQISQEAESAWDSRMERLTRNVFNAVLRKDLPKPLLDEANNLVLNSTLVRQDFSVTYKLSDEKFSTEDCEFDCVLVEAVMEFTMLNVSTDTVDWPVKVLLPNPVHPDLKHRVGVKAISVIKGGQAVALEFENGKAQFQKDLQDDTRTAIPFDAGKASLAPGESCRFSTSYTMAKEAEDTELLATLYPADGLRLTIFDEGKNSRLIFARSVHRLPLKQVSDEIAAPGVKIFKVPGYLLPHQGVLIWWKRKPTPTSAQPKGLENA